MGYAFRSRRFSGPDIRPQSIAGDRFENEASHPESSKGHNSSCNTPVISCNEFSTAPLCLPPS